MKKILNAYIDVVEEGDGIIRIIEGSGFRIKLEISQSICVFMRHFNTHKISGILQGAEAEPVPTIIIYGKAPWLGHNKKRIFSLDVRDIEKIQP